MFHGGDRAGRAGGRGGAGGIQSDRASAKLRIEGLHYEVTEAELKVG